MIPAMGLSMAVSTLVGQNIGAGNIDRAERIGRLGAWLGFWILSGMGVIVFIFAPQFVSFFVPSDPRRYRCRSGLPAHYGSLMGLHGRAARTHRGVAASGDMVITMVLTLVSQLVLQFPPRICAFRAHCIGSTWHLVGISCLEHCHCPHYTRCIRARRLEKETVNWR